MAVKIRHLKGAFTNICLPIDTKFSNNHTFVVNCDFLVKIQLQDFTKATPFFRRHAIFRIRLEGDFKPGACIIKRKNTVCD